MRTSSFAAPAAPAAGQGQQHSGPRASSPSASPAGQGAAQDIRDTTDPSAPIGNETDDQVRNRVNHHLETPLTSSGPSTRDEGNIKHTVPGN